MVILRKPELCLIFCMSLVWLFIFIYTASYESLIDNNSLQGYFGTRKKDSITLNRKLWNRLTKQRLKEYESNLLKSQFQDVDGQEIKDSEFSIKAADGHMDLLTRTKSNDVFDLSIKERSVARLDNRDKITVRIAKKDFRSEIKKPRKKSLGHTRPTSFATDLPLTTISNRKIVSSVNKLNKIKRPKKATTPIIHIYRTKEIRSEKIKEIDNTDDVHHDRGPTSKTIQLYSANVGRTTLQNSLNSAKFVDQRETFVNSLHVNRDEPKQAARINNREKNNGTGPKDIYYQTAVVRGSLRKKVNTIPKSSIKLPTLAKSEINVTSNSLKANLDKRPNLTVDIGTKRLHAENEVRKNVTTTLNFQAKLTNNVTIESRKELGNLSSFVENVVRQRTKTSVLKNYTESEAKTPNTTDHVKLNGQAMKQVVSTAGEQFYTSLPNSTLIFSSLEEKSKTEMKVEPLNIKSNFDADKTSKSSHYTTAAGNSKENSDAYEYVWDVDKNMLATQKVLHRAQQMPYTAQLPKTENNGMFLYASNSITRKFPQSLVLSTLATKITDRVPTIQTKDSSHGMSTEVIHAIQVQEKTLQDRAENNHSSKKKQKRKGKKRNRKRSKKVKQKRRYKNSLVRRVKS